MNVDGENEENENQEEGNGGRNKFHI